MRLIGVRACLPEVEHAYVSALLTHLPGWAAASTRDAVRASLWGAFRGGGRRVKGWPLVHARLTDGDDAGSVVALDTWSADLEADLCARSDYPKLFDGYRAKIDERKPGYWIARAVENVPGGTEGCIVAGITSDSEEDTVWQLGVMLSPGFAPHGHARPGETGVSHVDLPRHAKVAARAAVAALRELGEV